MNIPYGKQYITDEDVTEVCQTLKADFLTQGPKIEEFEDNFAKYVGARYAVAVSNGTAALHLSTLALGVSQGTKVISTPITFAASTNAVLYCGGQIEFVDIDPKTALIDLNNIENILELNPRDTFSGIIPVDFMGIPVDLEKLRAIADKYDLWIIEDACHAPGGYFLDSKGQKNYCGNGQFADLAIFSFHPVKHIACGEGGMITTNRKDLYEHILKLRTHGITKDPDLLSVNHGGWYYEMQVLGYNYRLSDIQASLGISQLRRADIMLQKRREIALTYDKAFKDSPISIFKPSLNVGHAYHLYVIQVRDRKGLYDFLRSHQIYSQIHYIPLHLMPYYQKLGWKNGDFPLAEKYYQSCISLPMFPTLSEEEQAYVIDKVLEFVK